MPNKFIENIKFEWKKVRISGADWCWLGVGLLLAAAYLIGMYYFGQELGESFSPAASKR